MALRLSEKLIWLFVGAVFLFLALPSGSLCETLGFARDKAVFIPSGVSIVVERADSPEKRALGLMHRTSLGPREGMMFLFEETAYHGFWMYNTRIPLTVIFLDENLVVVDIQNMTPCRHKDPAACPAYVAKMPARYAIEVNIDFTTKHRIEVGHRVRITREKP
jgi:hypothetical protein